MSILCRCSSYASQVIIGCELWRIEGRLPASPTEALRVCTATTCAGVAAIAAEERARALICRRWWGGRRGARERVDRAHPKRRPVFAKCSACAYKTRRRDAHRLSPRFGRPPRRQVRATGKNLLEIYEVDHYCTVQAVWARSFGRDSRYSRLIVDFLHLSSWFFLTSERSYRNNERQSSKSANEN